MKTTEKNHGISSMTLQSFIQAKAEKILPSKIKGMNSSKSAKSISVNAHSNPFKKSEKRLEVRDLKEKSANSSHVQPSASEQKHANKSTKPLNQESNKIISNQQEQNAHNPEHFLARNQLYEKQKQLKLQFERRKKLYGINSEQKIKPNLLVKENGGNEDEEELAERAKTYKEMYYKKYGKFKVQEVSKVKKKNKNYEELMKESIERFNEKFLSGLDSSHQRITNKHSAFTSQEHSLKTNITNIAQVQEKIKTLMQKLNLQEEMNMSIETIEELSRIEMMDDAKASEISSSGLFQKVDQDNHFEETEEIVIPSELQDNDEIQIEEIINNSPENHTVEADNEKNDQLHVQQVVNNAAEPTIFAQNDAKDQQNHEVQTQMVAKIAQEENCQQQVQQKQEVQSAKEEETQVNDCLLDEDIDIAAEASDANIHVQVFRFNDAFCPKVGQGLNPRTQPEEINFEEVTTEDNLNKQSTLSLQNAGQPQQQTQLQVPCLAIIESVATETKCQEIADGYSSRKSSYDVCLESFIDLQGNPHQNIEVQVQNFGFCRFLIIDSDSDSQTQPQH